MWWGLRVQYLVLKSLLTQPHLQFPSTIHNCSRNYSSRPMSSVFPHTHGVHLPPPEHSILLSKMPASSCTQSDPANVSKDGREVPVREACANCQSYGKLSRALEYSQSTPVLCPLFVTLSKRGLHCYLFMHKFYFFSIWKTCGNRHHRF